MFLILGSLTANAQRGNNALEVGVEAGITAGEFADFRNSPGVYGKLLFGVGTSGQVTLATGYSSYTLKHSNRLYKEKAIIKPIMAGYRWHAHGFYVEPQLGYGFYDMITKVQSGGTTTKITDSEGAVTWALGGGFRINKLDLGVRYQQGSPGGSNVSLFAIHAGYQFSF